MGYVMNSTDDFAPSLSAASMPSSIGSSVIPIINKLQDILSPIGGDLSKIQLPQVAVIGSQSSGKSSVLEALVGRDFLPRGCGICTRRPLVLQLVNRSDSDDRREWGEFLHLPGQLFHDFSKIRSEIQAETGREAGNNKGVSDKQIRLKISSPNVLNITLVDLPGITKVPVGDQPSDIETRIRKMIMSYIKQEACVILAVSPANSDLATSDALQMAKEADPAGSRTIGVITKLDIMDRGTNARDFLLGKVVPLHLGYVGVVNRSQEDINKNRSISEALAYEEQFFRDKPVYSGLSVCCGIPQLAKKLNQILEQHIRMVLPGLKAELNSHLLTVGKELRTYGEVVESKADQGAVLSSILTKYCEAFSALVDGRSQEIAAKELSGGARIKYIFQSMFVKSLEEVDPCEDFFDEDIRTAIQNATGPKYALFVPEAPFEVLVRTQIARLLHPSLQCLQLVYDELLKMSRTCETIEIQRFPILRRRLDEVIGKFLLDGRKPAERMIESIIEMEMDYINSSHPNFIGGNKAVDLATQQLKSSQGNRPQSNNDKAALAGKLSTRAWSIFGLASYGGSTNRSPGDSVHNIEQMPSHIQLGAPPAILRPPEIQTDNEAVEVMVTKLLLKSYYDIVRKNVQDLIPKAIMHYLVNHMKRDLLNTLIQKLYSERHEEMLQEEDEVVMKRKQTSERFHIMQQAVQTLDEFEADVSSRSSSSGTDTSKKITLSKSRVPDLSQSGVQSSSPGRSKQKQ